MEWAEAKDLALGTLLATGMSALIYWMRRLIESVERLNISTAINTAVVSEKLTFHSDELKDHKHRILRLEERAHK